MAKKAKKTGFSIQGFDAAHYRQTEEYLRAIDAIYQQAVNDFALLGERLKIDPDKPFSLADYPSANAKTQQIVNNLASRMQAVVNNGSKREWLYACRKNDEFLNHILNTSRLSKKTLQKFQDRNLSALSAFQKRKVDGLDLSKRIWRYADQFKSQMELGLDIGLGDGKSAQGLSKELRSFLVDPDKLFRRVRDKHGNLVLSKNAKAFNPGQGKYRSSYKNAMRLARSEINMAYRESDHLRWQKLDFVVGFEVKVSNKHEAFLVEWEKSNPGKVEICDQLKGRYPKTFVFKGWHPQCMCYAVPILMDPDEYNTDELNELRAALRGEEYNKFQSRNTVTDVPEGFKDWVKTNAERAQGWKSQPYFVRDNFKGANLENGLKLDNIAKNLIAQEMKYDFTKGIDAELKKEMAKSIEQASRNITSFEQQIEVYRKELADAAKKLAFDKYVKNYKQGENIPKTVERDTGTFELHNVEKDMFSNKMVAEYRKYKSEGATASIIEGKIKKYVNKLSLEKERLTKLKSGELREDVRRGIIRKREEERADEIYYKFIADKELVPDIAKQIKNEFGAENTFKAKSTKTEYIATKKYGKIRVSDHDSRFEQDQQALGGKATENRPVEFEIEDHNIVIGRDKNGITVRVDDKEYYIYEYNINDRQDLIRFIISKLKRNVN